MRTVSALVLEEQRFENYEDALLNAEPNLYMSAFTDGIVGGLAMFIQQGVNALGFWFGGWLLIHYPADYTFNDFLLAQFSILFSLFGLGSAFSNVSDRGEVEKSAARVFHLLDRASQIDSLSTEGKKLD
jgi:ATP-binding cassette, subfamily B (MDR/TAP), member 1